MYFTKKGISKYGACIQQKSMIKGGVVYKGVGGVYFHSILGNT
jgi:hypothetical protein